MAMGSHIASGDPRSGRIANFGTHNARKRHLACGSVLAFFSLLLRV